MTGSLERSGAARKMPWYVRDFDCLEYFEIYRDKEAEAAQEGPALARLLDLPPGSVVLDLPSGWGRLRPALEARGYRVFGGDLSPLSLARQGREFPGPSVRMDLRRIPYRDACAEGILCAFTSWGYFATEAENLCQLREYARLLKPGGVLLLDLAGRDFLLQSTREGRTGWYWTREGYRERVRWSADGRRILAERNLRGSRFRHDIWIPADGEVRAALEAAGLELQEAYGGLEGDPWHADAERWIYRALRRG